MNKKTKNKIMGIIIKSCFVFDMLWLIVWIVVAFKYGGSTSNYYAICASIWLFMAILSLFLLFKFPEAIEMPKVKAHKFPLNISSYNEFIKHLDNNIEKIGYKKYEYFNSNKELSRIYYRNKNDVLEYYTVYHFDEIKENITKTFDYTSTFSEEFYNSYYQGKERKDIFIETIIIWVDKESENFKQIVNTNVGNYDGLLIVGVSPSKNLIYVADEKEGGDKMLYWRLRKNFLKVMHLKMKDKIKK